MYFLDELKDFYLYKRKYLLPINDKDKRHGGLAFVLSPNIESTKKAITHPLFINKYYSSFYTEKAVLYYVNQEGEVDLYNAEYITEKAKLFKDSDSTITFNGYDHNVKVAKAYISSSSLIENARKLQYRLPKHFNIEVNITESLINTTKDSINLVPINKMPKEFIDYANYCVFNMNMWIIYQMNPKINDWLCMACALRECDINTDGNKYSWKFHPNLGILNMGLINYEKEHGRDEYIRDIIKDKDGLKRLELSLSDIIYLTAKDTQSTLRKIIFGEDAVDPDIENNIGIVTEDASYNNLYKKLFYKGRMKSNKELKDFYDTLRKDLGETIRFMYTNLSLYKKLNLFVDLSYYMNAFVTTNTLKKVRGAKAFSELMKRLISDKRFTDAGYNKQTVIIPIKDWISLDDNPQFYLVNNSINPISCIYYLLNTSSAVKPKDIFGDREVLFLGNKSYMKINFAKYEEEITPQMFLRNIKRIIDNAKVDDPEDEAIPEPFKQGPFTGSPVMSLKASPKAIKVQIIDDLEKSQKIKMDDITSDEEVGKEYTKAEMQKKELAKQIEKAAERNDTVDKTLDSMETDEEEAERIKKIISDLSTNPDDRGNNISGARASRMLQLQNDFMDSEFEGKKIKDIILADPGKDDNKVEPISLKVDSVNPEWSNLKFAATIESYNLEDDIIRIFNCFSDKTYPLAIREVTKKDTSTTNDLKETYDVKYEDGFGKRFELKVDIPKLIDNKYMILRGNRKNIPIQLFLMPIIKTGADTVQIVSCYKKIFVRRFGTTSGKSNVAADKLLKALRKEYSHIKVTVGDNTRVCAKYEFPIDYIDIASNFSIIDTPKYTFNFNYDEVLKKYDVDERNGICVGINKKSKELVYYKNDPKHPVFFSWFLYTYLADAALANTSDREEFVKNFNEASTSVRYTYSRASILNSKIPVIVICGLAEGLEPTLKKAHIKYNIVGKLPKYDKTLQDVIKFQDGYLIYDLDYNSSLLLNGLKQCPTDDYPISNINSRIMYIHFLDSFGGRQLSDGLDNFYDCMIDPITKETLTHYKLPTDYVSVLLHANLLLSDNKFTKHGDIRASRRFRKAEQIASYMYEEICKSYESYAHGKRRGWNIGFSMKQSAVIDRLLVGNTTNDQSVLNALGEYEALYAVTPQGPSGMNSDRAYSLDKRSYDDSMLNVLSASTNHAGSVGITRQATIDANVEGSRGYIYNDPDTIENEINSVKTLCMTESITPFTSTRDDPMRLAMGFIQTSKHGMRCEKSDPQLISTGADQALPYLISNTFAYKAKDDGKVTEIDPDKYMIVEYKHEIENGAQEKTKFEYIDLQEHVEKNSSSGFYITLKLDTDLKVGKTFKKNDILAYDRKSFSNEVGEDDNLAYSSIGPLTKYAILNTDEGFEDSAIISDALSEGLASDIVLEKEIILDKDTNIYNLVKKGQSIQEGDTLLVMQNSYDEEDVNILLRNLAGSEEEITNLGRKSIVSKVTGTVQDIIIKRTCELNDMSPSLKKVVSVYEKEINESKKKMKDYGIEDVNKTLPDTKALPPTGDLKKAYDSVVIKIYLKYHDKFSTGCKLIYETAVKGVAKSIFPKGLEPYSQYRKDEIIHALLSIGSINARMVTSVLITNGINKALIEMSRRVKEMAGIPWEDNLLE